MAAATIRKLKKSASSRRSLIETLEKSASRDTNQFDNLMNTVKKQNDNINNFMCEFLNIFRQSITTTLPNQHQSSYPSSSSQYTCPQYEDSRYSDHFLPSPSEYTGVPPLGEDSGEPSYTDI